MTDDTDRPTLKDVDHTPPTGAGDANRVFERGGERRPVTADGGTPPSRSPDEDDEDDDPVEA